MNWAPAEGVWKVLGVDNVGDFIRVMFEDNCRNPREKFLHPYEFAKLVVWGQQALDARTLETGE